MLKHLAPVFLGLGLALVATVILFLIVGESPWILFQALYNVFLTPFGLSYTLFYATPLMFTALGFSVALYSGIFTLGAEGQLYLGSLAVVAVSQVFPEAPFALALFWGILASATAGASLSVVAGFLKVYRGSHEVIVTILLNFISISLVNFAIIHVFKNPHSQNTETLMIPANYYLPQLTLSSTTPVNLAFPIALILCGLMYLLIFKSVFGFELRAAGLGPRAARIAGISTSKNMIVVFFISGAISGLVGLNEIMGFQHKLIEGFSPQYGFTGIAVCLLAKKHPLAIPFSAILFGGLYNSARELEFLSQNISKELSFIIQGMIIAFVASPGLWRWTKDLRKQIRRRKQDVAVAS